MLKDLLQDLEKVTVIALEQQGVDKNTNLSKSVKFVEIKQGIQLETAYYFSYVNTGRKARVRKVPIQALIAYIKDRGITPRIGQTTNQLAYAIQNHIYKFGINPKNYLDKITDSVGALTQERLADALALSIADELVDMFKI